MADKSTLRLLSPEQKEKRTKVKVKVNQVMTQLDSEDVEVSVEDVDVVDSEEEEEEVASVVVFNKLVVLRDLRKLKTPTDQEEDLEEEEEEVATEAEAADRHAQTNQTTEWNRRPLCSLLTCHLPWTTVALEKYFLTLA